MNEYKDRSQRGIDKHAANPGKASEPTFISSLFESAGDAVVSKTPEGIITSWNAAAERMFGFSREEAVGRPILILVPEELQGEEKHILDRIRAGERVDHYDTIRRRKDGSLIEVSLTISPIFDPEGKVVGASKIARDVTVRKRAEKEMLRRRSFDQQVIDSINDCVKVLGFDGNLESINRGGCLLLEVEDPGAILGRPLTDFWGSEYHDTILNALDNARAGRNSKFVGFCRNMKGRPMWWDVTVSPVRSPGGAVEKILALSRDISEQKRAEEEIENQSRILSGVLDALPVGVIVADPEGQIIRDNAASRDIWGATPSTSKWEDYDHWVGYWPDTGERIRSEEWAMSRALLYGQTVRDELVESVKFGSGERRYFLNNAAPVRDAAGNIIGGVVAELDVTKRIADEFALKKSEARLAAAVEMVGLGVWEYDADTDITDLDERAAEIFGLGDRRIIFSPDMFELIHPDDRERVSEEMQNALELGSDGQYRTEFRIVRADGSLRGVVSYGKRVPGTEGLPRFVGTVIDVTADSE